MVILMHPCTEKRPAQLTYNSSPLYCSPLPRSHPFMYFPTFYALKGVVENRPVASSMQKYRDEMWENVKACWSVWVPAQLINFAFVPRHLRIPFGE